jgi:hypothetical protein
MAAASCPDDTIQRFHHIAAYFYANTLSFNMLRSCLASYEQHQYPLKWTELRSIIIFIRVNQIFQ